MVGKDPHRPEGKTKDAEHMSPFANAKDKPFDAPSAKKIAEQDREMKDRRGGPTRLPGEEEVGGSRPGVGSRVKDAIGRHDAKKR